MGDDIHLADVVRQIEQFRWQHDAERYAAEADATQPEEPK